MYAQHDMTAEQREQDRIITSDEFQAGIEWGWKLAEAHWGVSTERLDAGNG